MKKHFSLIFILVFYSCSNSEKNPLDQHVSPQYVVLATKLRSEVANKLSKEFHMTPVGEGGSFYDCVREIFLAFEIQGPLTKDQLRNVLVNSVEELRSAVNSNEELRPYLIVYPFTSQEIEITLFVSSKWDGNIYDPDISSATARKGNLIYRTTDKSDTFKYKSKATESYEDALKIIRPMSLSAM